MTCLLVLRSEGRAEGTAAKARELGLDVVCMPLFELEPIDWTAPEPAHFDGLLLTSANAVWCAGDALLNYRGLKAYAVGEATADAARKAGFDIGGTGDFGVDRLLGSIEPELKLLHVCGEHRREPIRARQSITPAIVYRSKEIDVPDLNQTSSSVALIHSPRAAQRFAQLVTDRHLTMIAAISSAAADSAGTGWKKVSVADRPSEDALLALAARLCKNPDPG